MGDEDNKDGKGPERIDERIFIGFHRKVLDYPYLI